MQLAIDRATNDIIKKDGGGVVRVSEGRYTIQAVRSKLRTMLGEWLLNPSIGWLSLADFEKNPDLFDIEMRATAIILETKGVKSVDSMTLTLSKRILNVAFEATTIYGTISLDEPWEY